MSEMKVRTESVVARNKARAALRSSSEHKTESPKETHTRYALAIIS